MGHLLLETLSSFGFWAPASPLPSDIFPESADSLCSCSSVSVLPRVLSRVLFSCHTICSCWVTPSTPPLLACAQPITFAEDSAGQLQENVLQYLQLDLAPVPVSLLPLNLDLLLDVPFCESCIYHLCQKPGPGQSGPFSSWSDLSDTKPTASFYRMGFLPPLLAWWGCGLPVLAPSSCPVSRSSQDEASKT